MEDFFGKFVVDEKEFTDGGAAAVSDFVTRFATHALVEFTFRFFETEVFEGEGIRLIGFETVGAVEPDEALGEYAGDGGGD